jgi:hypothetical protein
MVIAPTIKQIADFPPFAINFRITPAPGNTVGGMIAAWSKKHLPLRQSPRAAAARLLRRLRR